MTQDPKQKAQMLLKRLLDDKLRLVEEIEKEFAESERKFRMAMEWTKDNSNEYMLPCHVAAHIRKNICVRLSELNRVIARIRRIEMGLGEMDESLQSQ